MTDPSMDEYEGKTYDDLARRGDASERTEPLVDDPDALAAAEAEVNAKDPEDVYAHVDESWVRVFGPSKLQGLLDVAGRNACVIAMPLDAEGIEYAWDPYPPEEMPGATTPDRALERPFSLLVAPQDAQRARELLADAHLGSPIMGGAPASRDLTAEAARPRRTLAWTVFAWFTTMGLALLVYNLLYALYRLVRYHAF